LVPSCSRTVPLVGEIEKSQRAGFASRFLKIGRGSMVGEVEAESIQRLEIDE
jgi:hypothetical protein